MSREERKAMITPSRSDLSLSRQCELVSISRSSFYYTPRGESADNLALMRRIDVLFLRYPFYGSRQIVRQLRREGLKVGRHRVRRLMRRMGLEAIYRAPRTSTSHPEHRVYPYLLRNVAVTRPDQVWCADISYIPVRRGFLYLVAIMDWASRHVLAWRLSNTMDAGFRVEALKEALGRYGKPDICKLGDERRAAFWRGRFLVASFRTGRAPFVTHPALQKTRRSWASSSWRDGIVRSWSIRADIVRCSLHARAVS